MEETRLPAERELEGILGLEENEECREEEHEEQPTGMRCDCKNLVPGLLNTIEDYYLGQLASLDRNDPKVQAYLYRNPEIVKELDRVSKLALGCGYGRNSDGFWDTSTRLTRLTSALSRIHNYTIIKEHDDGDLTIQTPEGKAVVTTEGEIFYEKK